ncbi:tRNA-intron lyase [archaeon]|jgi:tRNA-intron endonuclease, archaea type|nr:tRNA-intron lyase [archaeon]MBT4648212.1 tRNA-intron lyase [archaeon]MBT6822262.1 tRNA-intron lyase [archaeon]MBT7392636.1 tRNA-intron lyase [archaeon]
MSNKEETIKAILRENSVLTENSDAAKMLYNQSRFGLILKNERVKLSMLESLFLLENKKLEILDGRNSPFSEERFYKKAKKNDKNFGIRYSVYKDLRNRGYIVKTALKFGADFRVYDRGIKPGEDHAKWVVFPVHESSYLTWYDFSAKNRVAHSTKKKLLLGIVDDEEDVTYYEVKWTKP